MQVNNLFMCCMSQTHKEAQCAAGRSGSGLAASMLGLGGLSCHAHTTFQQVLRGSRCSTHAVSFAG